MNPPALPEQFELPIKLPSLVGLDPTYPTTFVTFPIFAPVQDRRLLDTKDFLSQTENVFCCEQGTVQRIGPGLNMYDEDTLIALMQLARQTRHEGNPGNFPIPLAPGIGRLKEAVISGVITAWEVNRYLNRPDSGQALEETRASIKRLALTQLRFLDPSGRETTCKFFEYCDSNVSDLKGQILIQFDPRVTEFLATYIQFDLELRMSLAPVGKAVYRYLSAVDAVSLDIGLQDLADRVAYKGALKDFRALVCGKKGRVSELEKMKRHGFIQDYSISGRGKTASLNLIISSR